MTISPGTPSKRSDIEAAFTRDPAAPIAAVIVTLNAPRKSDSPFATPVAPPRFMADANANLVAVMKKHGTRKIVTMSSIGVGDSFAGCAFIFRFMLRHTNMSAQFADHDLVDEEMKTSEMDYVLVRPVRLAEGESAPIKEWGNLGKGAKMMSSITRKSVAGFLIDAAEKRDWDRSTPVISN